MNTASLENCKKLYELSGWEDTEFWYSSYMNVDSSITYDGSVRAFKDRVRDEDLPAYDLGFLLRGLPSDQTITLQHIGETWKCIRYTGEYADADTPEDAACLLLILLIEQGIIDPSEYLPSNRTKTGAN